MPFSSMISKPPRPPVPPRASHSGSPARTGEPAAPGRSSGGVRNERRLPTTSSPAGGRGQSRGSGSGRGCRAAALQGVGCALAWGGACREAQLQPLHRAAGGPGQCLELRGNAQPPASGGGSGACPQAAPAAARQKSRARRRAPGPWVPERSANPHGRLSRGVRIRAPRGAARDRRRCMSPWRSEPRIPPGAAPRTGSPADTPGAGSGGSMVVVVDGPRPHRVLWQCRTRWSVARWRRRRFS